MKTHKVATKGPPKGELVLSRHQVCEKLGVSHDTVKRMEARGQLKPIRLNSRMIRYRVSDIDRMLQAHAAQGGAQ
jgi:predicted DNA-binding transcriptional regulator AlpA